MMAANVSAREEDMTGRNKTQKEAIESIRLLLAAGTDINGVDTQGRTAAHGAALWGMDRRRAFLHDNGLKLDIKDKRGYTALDTALGLAGGFGFGGSAWRRARGDRQSHPRTRRRPRHADSGPRRAARDRNQDDPQDGDRN